MTFTEIKTAVKDYCTLTSTEADTRIGKAINRHYRRITSTLGLEAARFVTRSASMTLGQPYVTFTNIEKIDRVLDTTDSTAIRPLEERSIHEIRSTQPSDGEPTVWALQNTGADSVTIRTDTVPQSAYSLQADGWTSLSDLTGTDEPAFPESFHDILVWYVTSEELLKKEKEKLAATYALKAESTLKELRFHLADSPTKDTRQGGSSVQAATGGSSGGGGTVGGTAYTQSAPITFDLDPLAPFIVTANSAVVTNLDADKLDGLDSTDFALQSAFADHSARHENGGADEISVLGLSGLLADSQNPLAHKTSHQSGGSDAIKLDDLSAPDDNTDLNASTSAHGLLKKLSNTATEFMNGQGAWAVPASGKVVQIVTATYGTQATSSTSAYADTGLTASITPTSASNKVLVLVTQAGVAKVNDTRVALKLLRDSTDLAVFAAQAGITVTALLIDVGSCSLAYLDSPASASALTYKTQFSSGGNVATAYVQQSSAVSSIVLMEVTP